MIFLDTNILLYAAASGPAEVAKQSIAEGLLARGDYATSAQVHAEFYYNATRKITPVLTHAEALAWLDDLARFPVVPLTAAIVARGARLADRYRISYWHGAIVAAAHEIGAATLFSEDLSDGQVYGTTRVVNPFADPDPRDIQ